VRILTLAPQPFYIVRGTPIDLDLVLRVLTSRENTVVDLVVYGQGKDHEYPNLRTYRTPDTLLTKPSGPGFSLRKLLCDAFLFARAWRLVRRHRYDLIHAGEETVFMAMFFRRFYGIPYAYDMDSSLAEQMTEKLPWLSVFQRLFNACQRAAIRRALVSFPVCNSLADLCRENGSRKTVTLHDISQLAEPRRQSNGNLKRELGIDGLVLLYVGNLETYQGIDLLLDGFALAAGRTNGVDLVIVGGSDRDIERYRGRATTLGIAGRTHFLGQQPFDRLDEYLAEADILAAPRIRGRNTPMKVFPYLHSGRAVLVTDLPTHSQILTDEVAMLAEPTPEGFSRAIVALAADDDLRRRLGERGRAFVEAGHTFPAHRERLDEAYDWIERELHDLNLQSLLIDDA